MKHFKYPVGYVPMSDPELLRHCLKGNTDNLADGLRNIEQAIIKRLLHGSDCDELISELRKAEVSIMHDKAYVRLSDIASIIEKHEVSK